MLMNIFGGTPCTFDISLSLYGVTITRDFDGQFLMLQTFYLTIFLKNCLYKKVSKKKLVQMQKVFVDVRT